MVLTQAQSRTISIRHASCEAALFVGVQTGVRLGKIEEAWMQRTIAKNVHRLRPISNANKAPVLKMALPANDNMAPWGQ